MKRLYIKDLKKGQVFYQIEFKIAAKFMAMEDAREVSVNRWACVCVRLRFGSILELREAELKSSHVSYTAKIKEENYTVI